MKNHIQNLRNHEACEEAVAFAEQYVTFADTIAHCDNHAWLRWALRMLPARQRVAATCHIVRYTPLEDGHRVWDLLTDQRSRDAIAVGEKFAGGEVTEEELRAAADSFASAYAYADYAYATYAAARRWQMDYIKSLDWKFMDEVTA